MNAKSSEREKQICERLRQFRESLQIPRTRFALSIGVTEAALAGYELGRARLRYETFAAVQKRFSINPVWLATGEENLLLYNWNDDKFRAQVKPREIFSQAYDRLIASHLFGERFNMGGTLANAKLAKDWFAALPRFRKAWAATGMSMEELARRLELIKCSPGTPEDLRAIIAGKKYPGARAVGNLIHELRIREEWLWNGEGGMFLSTAPPPGHFPDTKEARASLRLIIANVREYMESLSSSLGVLEKGLIEYEKDTFTRKS